jgi:hypothetical protein
MTDFIDRLPTPPFKHIFAFFQMNPAVRSMVSAFAMSSKFLYLSSASSSMLISNTRRGISSNINRPAPPPLAREEQREFETLLRAAQTPLSVPTANSDPVELALHPDAPQPLKAEFESDVNPKTGEEGGPKREPVGKWANSEGDWSFKGRVTDF